MITFRGTSFAPFITINRHVQSIQVGCDFLINETTDSYVWLFQAFLEAMKGLEPLHLITDQDLAMVAVIIRAEGSRVKLELKLMLMATLGP